MSRQPLRLRDDPSVSDEVKGLLQAFPGARASGVRSMTSAERSRAARRVAVIAAVPVTAGTLFGFKGLAIAAVLLAGGAVGVRAGVDAYHRSSTESVESTRTVSAPPAPTPIPVERSEAIPAPEVVPAPVEPSPEPAPPEIMPAPSPVPPGPATPLAPAEVVSADTLLAEAALLERARAVSASNPTAALRRLDEHRARFPHGKLSMERELIAVDALARAGRTSEARALGQSLLARVAGGLYEERVRALLASLP